MKQGRKTIEATEKIDRAIGAIAASGSNAEELAVRFDCSVSRIYLAKRRIAELDLAEELLPEIAEAVDHVLLGRCPIEVKCLILRLISRRIDPLKALRAHPHASRMQKLISLLEKARRDRGTRWPGAEAEVRVFGDGPVPVGEKADVA